MPKHYPDTDCHIERVLGAELGYLNGGIAEVDYFLGYPMNLVSEDQGQRLRKLRWVEWWKVLKREAGVGLFQRNNGISLILTGSDCVGGAFEVLPVDGKFGTERCLMDIPVGRGCTDAAKDEPVNPESITSPEDGTDIVKAPDIIQDNDHRILVRGSVSADIQTSQFVVGQFAHDRKFP